MMLIHLLLEGEDAGERRLQFCQNVVVGADSVSDALLKASRWLEAHGARLVRNDPEETRVLEPEQVSYPSVKDNAVVAATGRIWLEPRISMWRRIVGRFRT
ncbi:MAG: hypothetical protein ACYC8T_01675 [Myxococcaceae bacterium]